MKDAYGNEIEIGDIVVTSHRAGSNGIPSGVILGLVVGFTGKMVRINHGAMHPDNRFPKTDDNRLVSPANVLVHVKCTSTNVNDQKN